jgi:hypothetical protein
MQRQCGQSEQSNMTIGNEIVILRSSFTRDAFPLLALCFVRLARTLNLHALKLLHGLINRKFERPPGGRNFHVRWLGNRR